MKALPTRSMIPFPLGEGDYAFLPRSRSVSGSMRTVDAYTRTLQRSRDAGQDAGTRNAARCLRFRARLDRRDASPPRSHRGSTRLYLFVLSIPDPMEIVLESVRPLERPQSFPLTARAALRRRHTATACCNPRDAERPAGSGRSSSRWRYGRARTEVLNLEVRDITQNGGIFYQYR